MRISHNRPSKQSQSKSLTQLEGDHSVIQSNTVVNRLHTDMRLHLSCKAVLHCMTYCMIHHGPSCPSDGTRDDS